MNQILETNDISLPPNITPNMWHGIRLRKINNKLEYVTSVRDDSVTWRNDSVLKLIFQADSQYHIKDFDWILICTDDRSWRAYNIGSTLGDSTTNLVGDYSNRNHRWRIFSSCTKFNQWYETFPDFVYDKWIDIGINDYTDFCNRMLNWSTPPKTNNIGWRGSLHNDARKYLVSLKNSNFDFAQATADDWFTLDQMVDTWRYLIDVQGFGYSGRVKILLHLPRVLFLQDRTYKEDFYEGLQPWVHYVPVNSEFTDLEENFARLQADPDLEQSIIYNAQSFARNFLSRDAAVSRIAQILNLV